MLGVTTLAGPSARTGAAKPRASTVPRKDACSRFISGLVLSGNVRTWFGHPRNGGLSQGFQRNVAKFQGLRATLRPTWRAVASGTSPRTVTRLSPIGRTKNVVVPSSLEASAVRVGPAFGSTNTESVARPSV